MNDNVKTKQIINITKDTLIKENYKNNRFQHFVIVTILIFILIGLIDFSYYIFLKSQRIRIINKAVSELNFSEEQIKELKEKITEYEKIFNVTEQPTDKKTDDNSNPVK